MSYARSPETITLCAALAAEIDGAGPWFRYIENGAHVAVTALPARSCASVSTIHAETSAQAYRPLLRGIGPTPESVQARSAAVEMPRRLAAAEVDRDLMVAIPNNLSSPD
ncbi:hypothetical protein Q9R20_09250 [Microbacterium sp. PRF11]|uniref:hypothetical protein n=1 Tax=Microbacterium sp. PRF11 TaxID=2962593 RepID=UPI002880F1C8|nr:hypothetical protein [Microbacterium sp. PRF11]MDT0117179.1 hypothetical protein [Microbacterium sp. PRF11]